VLKAVAKDVNPEGDTVSVVLFATDSMVAVVVEVVYRVETSEEVVSVTVVFAVAGDWLVVRVFCVLDALSVFISEVDPLAILVEVLDVTADDTATPVVLDASETELVDVKVPFDKKDDELKVTV
jgi:hypothetical protein